MNALGLALVLWGSQRLGKVGAVYFWRRRWSR